MLDIGSPISKTGSLILQTLGAKWNAHCKLIFFNDHQSAPVQCVETMSIENKVYLLALIFQSSTQQHTSSDFVYIILYYSGGLLPAESHTFRYIANAHIQ